MLPQPPPDADEAAAALARRGIWIRRAAIGLFGFLVFALGASAIALRSVELDFGLRVWCQERWVAGSTHGLRLAAVDPEILRFHQGVRFCAELRPDEAGAPLQLLCEKASGPALSATVCLPPDLRPGSYRLVVRGALDAWEGETERSVEVLPLGEHRAELIATVSERASFDGGRRTKTPALPSGERMRLFPRGGALVPSLPNEALLLLTDSSDAPLAGRTVRLTTKRAKLDSPLPRRLVTDASGLAELTLHSGFQELLLTATVVPPAAQDGAPREEPDAAREAAPETPDAGAKRAPGTTGAQELFLKGKPVQFVARLLGGPLPRPGATVELAVRSLRDRGPVYADLYDGERWLGASSGGLSDGSALLQVPLPPGAARRPLRIEVFGDHAAPGAAHFTVWTYPTAPQGWNDALRDVEDRLVAVGSAPGYKAPEARPRGLSPEELQRRLVFLLDRLPRSAFEPPLSAPRDPTQRSRREAEREALYAKVRLMLWCVALAVLLAVAGRVLLHRVQLRRRYRDVALELDDDAPRSLERYHAVVQLMAILLLLALALGSILVLIDTLRWGLP